MMIDWDDHFKNPDSWPIRMVTMSRDVFNRNKEAVLKAAKKHHYRVAGATQGDPEALNYRKGVVEFYQC
jgi:hypothetical protein